MSLEEILDSISDLDDGNSEESLGMDFWDELLDEIDEKDDLIVEDNCTKGPDIIQPSETKPYFINKSSRPNYYIDENDFEDLNAMIEGVGIDICEELSDSPLILLNSSRTRELRIWNKVKSLKPLSSPLLSKIKYLKASNSFQSYAKFKTHLYYTEDIIISAQLRRNLHYKHHGPGTAEVLESSSEYRCIGTSRGLILIFNNRGDIYKIIDLPSELKSKNLSISAISIVSNEDKILKIISGYSDGSICIWDFDRGNLLKYIKNIHNCKITHILVLTNHISQKIRKTRSDDSNAHSIDRSSRTKNNNSSSEIHPNNSNNNHIEDFYFITIDSEGNVHRLHFSRVLWSSITIDSDCLLDSSTGSVLDIALLPPTPLIKTSNQLPLRAQTVEPVLSMDTSQSSTTDAAIKDTRTISQPGSHGQLPLASRQEGGREAWNPSWDVVAIHSANSSATLIVLLYPAIRILCRWSLSTLTSQEPRRTTSLQYSSSVSVSRSISRSSSFNTVAVDTLPSSPSLPRSTPSPSTQILDKILSFPSSIQFNANNSRLNAQIQGRICVDWTWIPSHRYNETSVLISNILNKHRSDHESTPPPFLPVLARSQGVVIQSAVFFCLPIRSKSRASSETASTASAKKKQGGGGSGGSKRSVFVDVDGGSEYEVWVESLSERSLAQEALALRWVGSHEGAGRRSPNKIPEEPVRPSASATDSDGGDDGGGGEEWEAWTASRDGSMDDKKGVLVVLSQSDILILDHLLCPVTNIDLSPSIQSFLTAKITTGRRGATSTAPTQSSAAEKPFLPKLMQIVGDSIQLLTSDSLGKFDLVSWTDSVNNLMMRGRWLDGLIVAILSTSSYVDSSVNDVDFDGHLFQYDRDSLLASTERPQKKLNPSTSETLSRYIVDYAYQSTSNYSTLINNCIDSETSTSSHGPGPVIEGLQSLGSGYITAIASICVDYIVLTGLSMKSLLRVYHIFLTNDHRNAFLSVLHRYLTSGHFPVIPNEIWNHLVQYLISQNSYVLLEGCVCQLDLRRMILTSEGTTSASQKRTSQPNYDNRSNIHEGNEVVDRYTDDGDDDGSFQSCVKIRQINIKQLILVMRRHLLYSGLIHLLWSGIANSTYVVLFMFYELFSLDLHQSFQLFPTPCQTDLCYKIILFIQCRFQNRDFPNQFTDGDIDPAGRFSETRSCEPIEILDLLRFLCSKMWIPLSMYDRDLPLWFLESKTAWPDHSIANNNNNDRKNLFLYRDYPYLKILSIIDPHALFYIVCFGVDEVFRVYSVFTSVIDEMNDTGNLGTPTYVDNENAHLSEVNSYSGVNYSKLKDLYLGGSFENSMNELIQELLTFCQDVDYSRKSEAKQYDLGPMSDSYHRGFEKNNGDDFRSAHGDNNKRTDGQISSYQPYSFLTNTLYRYLLPVLEHCPIPLNRSIIQAAISYLNRRREPRFQTEQLVTDLVNNQIDITLDIKKSVNEDLIPWIRTVLLKNGFWWAALSIFTYLIADDDRRSSPRYNSSRTIKQRISLELYDFQRSLSFYWNELHDISMKQNLFQFIRIQFKSLAKDKISHEDQYGHRKAVFQNLISLLQFNEQETLLLIENLFSNYLHEMLPFISVDHNIEWRILDRVFMKNLESVNNADFRTDYVAVKFPVEILMRYMMLLQTFQPQRIISFLNLYYELCELPFSECFKICSEIDDKSAIIWLLELSGELDEALRIALIEVSKAISSLNLLQNSNTPGIQAERNIVQRQDHSEESDGKGVKVGNGLFETMELVIQLCEKISRKEQLREASVTVDTTTIPSMSTRTKHSHWFQVLDQILFETQNRRHDGSNANDEETAVTEALRRLLQGMSSFVPAPDIARHLVGARSVMASSEGTRQPPLNRVETVDIHIDDVHFEDTVDEKDGTTSTNFPYDTKSAGQSVHHSRVDDHTQFPVYRSLLSDMSQSFKFDSFFVSCVLAIQGYEDRILIKQKNSLQRRGRKFLATTNNAGSDVDVNNLQNPHLFPLIHVANNGKRSRTDITMSLHQFKMKVHHCEMILRPDSTRSHSSVLLPVPSNILEPLSTFEERRPNSLPTTAQYHAAYSQD